MTTRYPIALWEDDEGGFTGRILDGSLAAAYDRTPNDVLAQLKKYLAWAQRRGQLGRNPDFEEPALRDLRVPIRMQYAADHATSPVPEPFVLRTTCVIARRRDGTRLCVVPTLDLRLSWQVGDPEEELIAEAIGQAVGKSTPQELSRKLMPRRMTLAAVHLGRQAPARQHDVAVPPGLAAVAERLGARGRGKAKTRALLRDREAAMLVELLSAGSTNLLLLGETGVGKSTLLAEAIRRLRPKKAAAKEQPRDETAAPARKLPQSFWLTSGQRLIAGMQYLGQWEERAEQVIAELAEHGGVLCVDSLTELVRVGSREPAGSVSAFLMPYLERGELRLVAEATPREWDACRRLLPGLADLFQVVRVPEFSPGDARSILSTLLDEADRNRRVKVEPGLADLVYRLFRRFQPYAAFPGRATGFVRRMIETAVRDRVTQIGQRSVLDRFQRELGLPEQLIRDDLPLPQSEVLAAFEGQILGQPSACQTTAAVVTALKTGLNDPNRPLGVLLFCGPTGVGKTETAKALARYLFGMAAKERLVRLDMSEYSGYGAAQRLLLSDDGSVSDFLRRVRRQPFVVLLLDEIEKAAPEVLDVLLGVLDEGQLTDRFGRATTFRSAVILMTSNLGAERRSSLGFGDAAQPAFERIAMTAFRPEFFNRIDAVVPFGPLDRATIAKLAERELESIARREGLAMAGRRLTWTPDVLAHLAEAGYDPRYGARPLQRAIEREVIAPLSAALLSPEGRTALRFDLILDEGRIVVCADAR